MALPVRCGTKWNPMAIDYVFIAADVCFLVALRFLACSLGGTCCCVWMSVLVRCFCCGFGFFVSEPFAWPSCMFIHSLSALLLRCLRLVSVCICDLFLVRIAGWFSSSVESCFGTLIGFVHFYGFGRRWHLCRLLYTAPCGAVSLSGSAGSCVGCLVSFFGCLSFCMCVLMVEADLLLLHLVSLFIRM